LPNQKKIPAILSHATKSACIGRTRRPRSGGYARAGVKLEAIRPHDNAENVALPPGCHIDLKRPGTKSNAFKGPDQCTRTKDMAGVRAGG